MGVVYVNVHISRGLKEELAWAIDKQLQLIINTLLFKIVIPLRIAMSQDFYKRTILPFCMQHEIELDVSFNLIYSFPTYDSIKYSW